MSVWFKTFEAETFLLGKIKQAVTHPFLKSNSNAGKLLLLRFLTAAGEKRNSQQEE
jgi:hypothetical protein